MTNSNEQRMACPNCGGVDLVTLERVSCVALTNGIFRDAEGKPDIAWEGTTEYDRGEQRTVGVLCESCDWAYEGKNWFDKLVAAVIECVECGEEMFVTDAGVSHHGTPDEIDHDADADHVAVKEDE